MTAADVTRVASEDIHPNQLIVVAVGDKTKIEPGLKAADLGSIEYRTLTGEPVSQAGK